MGDPFPNLDKVYLSFGDSTNSGQGHVWPNHPIWLCVSIEQKAIRSCMGLRISASKTGATAENSDASLDSLP